MNWLDFSVKVLAIIGGFIALFTFWRTAKVRRAEWLSSLHAKFFEASGYKRIRRILDSGDGDPELSRLRAEVTANQNSEGVEEFVDFLNFFEFVASLHELGSLCTRCHPERERGTWAGWAVRSPRSYAPPAPPGPSLTLGMTNLTTCAEPP